MSPRTDREQSLTVRTAYIWSGLVGLIGVIMLVLFDPGGGPTYRALSILGQALFSASVVAIAFGWISSEENELRIERIVRTNLRSILCPVTSRTLADVLENRSWRCHLEAPIPSDHLPDYLYQTITISYSTSSCPRDLRFIGIAAKAPDWSAYYSDNYQFRWEFDEGLDVEDPTVFNIGPVRLDSDLMQRSQTVTTTKGVEYVYRVRDGKQGLATDISFVVTVGKFVGRDVRISVPTKVFSDVNRPDFLLSVGATVGATAISSSCDGVTTLIGEPPELDVHDVADPFGNPVSRNVRVLGPIQRDSQVSFEIVRSSPRDLSG